VKKLLKAALLGLAAALVLGCAGGPKAPAGGEVQIAVLHTNDTHGHPLPFADHGVPEVSGLPAITTLVGRTRAEFENVLVLDAGDFNTGRPESNFFKAEPDIVGFNLIGYDAVALGNHEFDNSREILEGQKALAEFPLLSANAKTKDGKLVADAAYVVKEFQGVRVGVFGLTTRETATIGGPEVVRDLVFADEVETAKAMVAELRGKRKCQVVIALTHLGVYENAAEGSRALAAKVPGIDLIVDGHSHTQMKEPLVENGVPIVQAWQWGLNVGRGVLTVSGGKVAGFSWQPLTVNDKKAVKNPDGTTRYEPLGPEFETNPIVNGKLIEYGYKVESLLSEKIGVAAAVFSNAASRKAESEIGGLVADSMKWRLRDQGVDFAIVGGGNIRSDLAAGDITKKTAYTILPFDNSLVVLTMKGSELKELFDFLPTIPQGKGAFPQVSDGVSFTIDYEKGATTDILVGGKPLDPAREYKVVTNSYMAAGGDGYAVFKKARAYDSSVYQRDALVDYVKSLTAPLSPELKGRIKVVGQKLAWLFGGLLSRV